MQKRPKIGLDETDSDAHQKAQAVVLGQLNRGAVYETDDVLEQAFLNAAHKGPDRVLIFVEADHPQGIRHGLKLLLLVFGDTSREVSHDFGEELAEVERNVAFGAAFDDSLVKVESRCLVEAE